MNNIIVNADDFGARASVNKAIVSLFDSGILSSTTLMANMPGFDEAVELAHQHKIIDRVGAHLVLTEGVPLTEGIKSVAYLFNREQGGNIRRLLIKKLFYLDKTQKTLIYKEYSAQIEKIRSAGIKINHIDTHQHMHDMPGIMQVLIKLIKEHKIPAMRILNNLETTSAHKNGYRNLINKYLKLKGLNYSDYFGSRVDYLLNLERNPLIAENRTIEIMVHPDYNRTGEITDVFSNTEYNFDYIER
jgi:chitin disaccharide deacetylase